MGTGSFPGVKRPGRGADHPSPSSAEVKETEPSMGLRGPFWGELYITSTKENTAQKKIDKDRLTRHWL